MKKQIRIVYCDLSKNYHFPSESKYQRTACEFLLGTNYVNTFLKYLYNSKFPCVVSECFEGNCKIGYTIYLDYKKALNSKIGL